MGYRTEVGRVFPEQNPSTSSQDPRECHLSDKSLANLRESTYNASHIYVVFSGTGELMNGLYPCVNRLSRRSHLHGVVRGKRRLVRWWCLFRIGNSTYTPNMHDVLRTYLDYMDHLMWDRRELEIKRLFHVIMSLTFIDFGLDIPFDSSGKENVHDKNEKILFKTNTY